MSIKPRGKIERHGFKPGGFAGINIDPQKKGRNCLQPLISIREFHFPRRYLRRQFVPRIVELIQCDNSGIGKEELIVSMDPRYRSCCCNSGN
jgi:hypothetical protein